MRSIKRSNSVPDGAIIAEGFGKIDYCDSFAAPMEGEDKNVDQIMTDLLDVSSLAWIVGLKKLRNRLVRGFGLKTEGGEALLNRAGNYPVGAQTMIFTVITRNADEIVMGKDDKHLIFRVSLLWDRNVATAYVTTLVQYHHLGGRLYFWLIKPFHRLFLRVRRTEPVCRKATILAIFCVVVGQNRTTMIPSSALKLIQNGYSAVGEFSGSRRGAVQGAVVKA